MDGAAGEIIYRDGEVPPIEAVVELYRRLGWSSAEKPDELAGALAGSHGLVTAWCDGGLVGLANAISDGHLVVYYPHLAVDPDFVAVDISEHLSGKYLPG